MRNRRLRQMNPCLDVSSAKTRGMGILVRAIALAAPSFGTRRMRRRVGSAMACIARSSEASEDMRNRDIAKIDRCQCNTLVLSSDLVIPSARRREQRGESAEESAFLWWATPSP